MVSDDQAKFIRKDARVGIGSGECVRDSVVLSKLGLIPGSLKQYLGLLVSGWKQGH